MRYLIFAAVKFKVVFMSEVTQSFGKLGNVISLEVWKLGLRLPY
jgi:hypothetical protein